MRFAKYWGLHQPADSKILHGHKKSGPKVLKRIGCQQITAYFYYPEENRANYYITKDSVKHD